MVNSTKEFEMVKPLLQNQLPPMESCLVESKRGMTRPLVEVIATGAVQNVHDIERFIKCK